MVSSPIKPLYFNSFDGTRLAWREVGEGPPVLMLHGFFSTAEVNWIKFGHAAAIAAAGFRAVMPDLRAHGSSAKPHDAASYPPDVLMRDALALVDYLGLGSYDLVGYSLGARTAMRMLANGARPRRVVLSGMGLQGITDTAGRGAHFRHVLTNLGSFARGTNEWMAEAFLKTTGGDPQALLRILDTFVDTPPEAVAAVAQPVLVLAGEDDHDNGSAEALAAAMPDARYEAIPGNHMSAVLKPQLGQAIAAFLAAHRAA